MRPTHSSHASWLTSKTSAEITGYIMHTRQNGWCISFDHTTTDTCAINISATWGLSETHKYTNTCTICTSGANNVSNYYRYTMLSEDNSTTWSSSELLSLQAAYFNSLPTTQWRHGLFNRNLCGSLILSVTLVRVGTGTSHNVNSYNVNSIGTYVYMYKV